MEAASFLVEAVDFYCMKVQLHPIEKLLFQIEEPPFSWIFRAGVGFALLPLLYRLPGNDSSFLLLLLYFLLALLMLRIGLTVVRHAFPFSLGLREAWAKRRQLAKRYDSYQWRKLFWMGLGIVAYMILFDDLRRENGWLGLGCLLGGACGMWIWKTLGVNEKEAVSS